MRYLYGYNVFVTGTTENRCEFIIASDYIKYEYELTNDVIDLMKFMNSIKSFQRAYCLASDRNVHVRNSWNKTNLLGNISIFVPQCDPSGSRERRTTKVILEQIVISKVPKSKHLFERICKMIFYQVAQIQFTRVISISNSIMIFLFSL